MNEPLLRSFRLLGFFPVLAIFGCNPAGDLLIQARAQRDANTPDAALATYRDLLAKHPEAPEASLAAGEAPSLALTMAAASLPAAPAEALVHASAVFTDWHSPPDSATEAAFLAALSKSLAAKVDGGDVLGPAAILRQMEASPFPPSFNAAAEGLVAAQGDDKRLSSAVLWLGAQDSDESTRAEQAISLISDAPNFQPVIQDWLNAHLFAGAADVCLTPLADLATIDDMDVLDKIPTTCGVLVSLAPGASDVAEVQRLLAGPLEDRRRAVRSSPAYRIQQALAGCVEFQSWVSVQKANPPRTEAQMERVQKEMERRTPAMQRNLEYLVDRVQSTQDHELARQVSEACGG